MRIFQFAWSAKAANDVYGTLAADAIADLVLVFGQGKRLASENIYSSLQQRFPQAEIILGSTSGEIQGSTVVDGNIVVTAISFEKTTIKSALVNLADCASRRDAAIQIGHALIAPKLALVLLLADGQNVNGSELVAGINEVFAGKIPVVGGLAGDGYNFQSTMVGLNATPCTGNVAAIGFYGDDLEVHCSSQGGWEAFGPERKVTASNGNVLLEMDGKSALDLYKSYLGDQAADLPSSGLLFPLSVQAIGAQKPVVRTLLGINEVEKSLTFAGDIPVGATARLMKASNESLINGAIQAANDCKMAQAGDSKLAILVSCVGRKLILGQRVEEEVEEVNHILGDATLCGFYSYGEISPSGEAGLCELHNQTMTITTICER